MLDYAPSRAVLNADPPGLIDAGDQSTASGERFDAGL